MDDYILQQNLPRYLKKKSVLLDRDTFIYRAWRYKDVVELIRWLKVNHYIIGKIRVLSNIVKGGEILRYVKRPKLEYLVRFWNYRGDRNKNKTENIESNFTSALYFIEKMNLNAGAELLYEIYFYSENNMDQITKDFYYKAILASSGISYSKEDALELIERCRSEGLFVSGIEVFEITSTFIQNVDIITYNSESEDLESSEYFTMYHIKKNHDIGNWEKATQFIKENALPNYYFQITYHQG